MEGIRQKYARTPAVFFIQYFTTNSPQIAYLAVSSSAVYKNHMMT